MVLGIARADFSSSRLRAICFDLDVTVLGPIVIVLGMMFSEIDGVANALIENYNFKDSNARWEAGRMHLLLRIGLWSAL